MEKLYRLLQQVEDSPDNEAARAELASWLRRKGMPKVAEAFTSLQEEPAAGATESGNAEELAILPAPEEPVEPSETPIREQEFRRTGLRRLANGSLQQLSKGAGLVKGLFSGAFKTAKGAEPVTVQRPLPVRMTAYHFRVESQTGKYFESLTVEGEDLRKVHLGNRSFVFVSFAGADLSASNLAASRFSEVNFAGADLSESCLLNSSFQSVNFEAANLNGARFTASTFRGVRFEAANLDSARLIGVELQRVSFEGADLRNADLRKAKFDRVDFTHANLAGATFGELAFKALTLTHARVFASTYRNSCWTPDVLVRVSEAGATLIDLHEFPEEAQAALLSAKAGGGNLPLSPHL